MQPPGATGQVLSDNVTRASPRRTGRVTAGSAAEQRGGGRRRLLRDAPARATPPPSTGWSRSCGARCSTARSSRAPRCARWRWPRPWGSPARRSARRSGCWSPRGWPPASPTAACTSPSSTRSPCTTCARPGRCWRPPAYAAGTTPGEADPGRRAARRCARSPRWPPATPTPAELTAAHLAIHRSFVALTESARLVALAETLHRRDPARAGQGRPDPAQRRRPGALPRDGRRPPRARRGRGRRRRAGAPPGGRRDVDADGARPGLSGPGSARTALRSPDLARSVP